MWKTTKSAFVAWMTLASALPLHAQDIEDTQTFSDWRVTCEGDQGCRMSQAIVQASTNRLILEFKIYGSDDPTALITFPLGILLSTGWQYKIDNQKGAVLPFEICNVDGCFAGVKLSNSLIKSMKRGNKMSIRFFDAAQSEVNPVVSLAGFTKAYEAIQ
ncbi:invasion associated locus B family protein [Pseudosulfitobacter sp. SM2401]|uniref:invasion associated locus B family protein n=1 Tax=Pseudosulfitobacter sp. SM2401 TaxID=3350098 RepID=UPI0036F30256